MLEIFDPVIDFYRIRSKSEKRILFFIPIIIGVMCFCVALFTTGNEKWDGYEFASDLVNQFITILTLFVSFSMAYLSIIVSSSSQNIDDLKNTIDEERTASNGEEYSLYQILMAEITYTLVFEIIFLIGCVFEKFLMSIIDWQSIRIMICIDVAFFVHVLLMMLVVIKNIYFSFWKSK